MELSTILNNAVLRHNTTHKSRDAAQSVTFSCETFIAVDAAGEDSSGALYQVARPRVAATGERCQRHRRQTAELRQPAGKGHVHCPLSKHTGQGQRCQFMKTVGGGGARLQEGLPE